MSSKGTIIKKAFGAGAKISSAAMPIYFAASEYNRSRESGKGVLPSAARAGVDFAISEALGWKYALVGLAQAAPTLAVGAYNSMDQISRQSSLSSANRPFANSHFRDTQPAYTMRQYGMQLAQNSRYSLEQTLMGNEAQHFKY